MSALGNERHERFCQLVAIKGMHHYKAYLAVFSTDSKAQATKRAHKLLKRPEVQSRLGELDQVACDLGREVKVDQEWVLAQLHDVYVRCMDAIEIKDRHGNPTGQYRFDAKGAVAALKLIGMEHGLFRTVSTTYHGQVDPTEGLSRADLREMR